MGGGGTGGAEGWAGRGKGGGGGRGGLGAKIGTPYRVLGPQRGTITAHPLLSFALLCSPLLFFALLSVAFDRFW